MDKLGIVTLMSFRPLPATHLRETVPLGSRDPRHPLASRPSPQFVALLCHAAQPGVYYDRLPGPPLHLHFCRFLNLRLRWWWQS